MSKFFADVKSEFLKIKWPKRKQVQRATTVVVFFTVALIVYLGLFDGFFEIFMNLIKKI